MSDQTSDETGDRVSDQASGGPGGGQERFFEGELGRMLLARSVIDRAGERRTDDEWLAAVWADPGTRAFAVDDSRAEAVLDPEAGLVFRPGAVFDAGYPEAERYFLGLDDDDVAYFAVSVGAPGPDGRPTASTAGSASTPGAALTSPEPPAAEAAPALGELRHVREVAAVLPDRDGGLLAHAIGLDNWHRTHGFCSVCGNPTRITYAGSVRKCDHCGTEHYPRTDPAVIMAVVDSDDRLLLARNSAWPANRASVLAGFVEPGETLEAAVARECAEEAGLRITSVRYLGSQPWPLPRSLMLGFTTTVDDATLNLDGDELGWAKWYTRAELKEAVNTGELLMLPTDISIARRLVNHWYGGDPVAH
ncbi:NAD(+) diphosphatase [Catenulispora sp. NL8]|uniref:NAD(+) diphosphatase n=1 Tax=Catenulispora pinistramenti TaxID=2705254 RepID=A0ABS5KJF6_9ACTN|nr:NAD(+) diphosphatase [Catenulispora pinistramenti]MBS2546050.1 NAD(+) diphosphatase [Catenulispora pinistramenti]